MVSAKERMRRHQLRKIQRVLVESRPGKGRSKTNAPSDQVHNLLDRQVRLLREEII